MNKKEPLLTVENLSKYFKKSGHLFKAVNNVNFDVYKGDFFGIIGESGSGKSTTGKLIIRLLEADNGNVIFDDNLISQKNICKKIKKFLTKNMQMIFQDPMGSLNPKKNVLNLISEPLRINKSIKKEAWKIINDHILINPFFQYTYKQKDFELSKEFDNYYFPNMIEVFNDAIKKLNNFKYDKNLQFNENKFNFINILMNLDEKSKKINYSLYKHSKDIKQVFNYAKEMHDNQKNDPIEIELFNLQQEYNDYLKFLKYGKDVTLLKKQLVEQNKKIHDFETNSYVKYKDQINVLIQGMKSSILKEIKLLKSNLELCIDYVNGLEYEIKIFQKNLLLLFIDKIKNEFVLDVFDSKKVFNFIYNEIKIDFKLIWNQYTEIKKIKEQKNHLIDKHISNSAIKKILKSTNFFHKHKKVNETIINAINSQPELKELANELSCKTKDLLNNLNKINIDFIYKKHFQNILVYIKSLPSYTKCIQDDLKYNILIDERNIIKYTIDVKKIDNKKENKKQIKKEFNDLQYKLLIATKKCNDLYIQGIEKFNKEILPLINEHKQKLKQYKSDLTKAKKGFAKILNKKINEITKFVKSNKIEKDKELIKSFKTDAILKKKTIDALSFEFNVILEEVNLFRNLRNKNKYYVKLHFRELVKTLTRIKVYGALNSVGLKNEHAYRYPHEFSGGQRQRIVIARALINEPKLIIADEPISALDVSIQAQVINIMKKLADEKGITFLFIAHDLSMVNYACNRMIIMQNGRILEKGDTNNIFKNPIHPYTKSLLKAAPQLSKIHIDLANFSNIENEFNSNTIDDSECQFHSISNEYEHFVYGTQDQIEVWKNKKIH